MTTDQLRAVLACVDQFNIGDRVLGDKMGRYLVRRGGAWQVRAGEYVVNRDGICESEPMPSNRDEAFVSRTRFTFREALALARQVAIVDLDRIAALEAVADCVDGVNGLLLPCQVCGRFTGGCCTVSKQ